MLERSTGARANRVRRARTAGGLAGMLCAALLFSGCTGGEADAGDPATDASASVGASTTAPASAAPSSAVPAGAFDQVLVLVLERLATGDSVAASKLFSGQPVTDEAREKAVLDAAAARAQEVGADPGYVAQVFTDQITASKQVQQSLLDAWADGVRPAPASAPDLATEVRPILDRITNDLVPALGAVELYRSDPGCATALDQAATAAAAGPAAAAMSPSALDALPTAIAHLCD